MQSIIFITSNLSSHTILFLTQGSQKSQSAEIRNGSQEIQDVSEKGTVKASVKIALAVCC